MWNLIFQLSVIKINYKEKGCNGVPDWIIEITSPSAQNRDYLVKLLKYRASGVCEYWIVNPSLKTVLKYYFENNMIREINHTDNTHELDENTGMSQEFSFGENFPVEIFNDLQINIAELLI